MLATWIQTKALSVDNVWMILRPGYTMLILLHGILFLLE